MKTLLIILAWVFIFLGIGTTFWFLLAIHYDGHVSGLSNIQYEFSNKYSNSLGGLVGPLISAAGFFFLYINFNEQRDTLKRTRLESKFFKMMEFHRANINEMTFTSCERPKPGVPQDEQKMVTAEKRKVFKVILSQFEELYIETRFLFIGKKEGDIYESNYLDLLKLNQTIEQKNINLTYAQLDLLYLIIFFGAGADGKKTILQLTNGKYKLDFVGLLLDYVAFKPKKEFEYWNEWKVINKLPSINKVMMLTDILSERADAEKSLIEDGIESISKYTSLEEYLIYHPNSYDKYYGGQQFRLGHYFRNIFQAVKCIHDDNQLSKQEKYDYVKILRGQLSTVEQILFFLNSLSQLGRDWELENDIQDKNRLITTYNLIKNLPNRELIDGITYMSFYPLVSYETSDNKDIKKQRTKLNYCN
jgi:hypothetical protein